MQFVNRESTNRRVIENTDATIVVVVVDDQNVTTALRQTRIHKPSLE